MSIINSNDENTNPNVPFEKPLQKLKILKTALKLTQITATDIEKYSTLDESTYQCHICGFNEHPCTTIQNDMKRALGVNVTLMSVPSKSCGREGTVFFFSTTIVKILAINKDDHTRRTYIWRYAEKCKVGPRIIHAWFTPFEFEFVDDDNTGWSGWSCIQSTKLKAITNVDLDKVKSLLYKTAMCGLLHMDPSLDNIMIAENDYLFVDWEDALQFKPRIKSKRSKRCPFCLIAYTIMIASIATSLRKNETKSFTELQINNLNDLYDENLKYIHAYPKHMKNFCKIVVPPRLKNYIKQVLRFSDCTQTYTQT